MFKLSFTGISSSCAAWMARTAFAVSIAAVCINGVHAAQPQTFDEKVDGFLAAGEFGAAVDAARHAPDADRERLLRSIAAAQFEAGDPQGAQGTVAQLASPRARVPARAELGRKEALAGGMGADFDSLIQLIQDHTEGPWFDVDGIGGTIGPFESGIRVDPHGLLSRSSRTDETGRLAALGVQIRRAALNDEMSQPSTLRMVSLTRLEREVARRLAEGKPVVESMRHLAGLSQIQYVFVYPDEHEIVIAGPAEGWQYNQHGMAVGLTSNRPTLHLDDLVTVLRTFDANGQRIFGCSIDPRQENLKALQQFVAASQANGPLSPGSVRGWANKLGQVLGLQDVTVYGVPQNSRVCRVLVEADYRMKLIGIGKLEGGTHVPDYFELLARHPHLAGGSLDALRWWLTMNYDEVLHAADHNAFEIRGSSVRCQSENQFLTENGQRVSSGKAEPINQQFAANFTQHYAELAERDPIFADLQGVFDLALVAALIQHEGLDQRAGWDRGVFAAAGEYRPAAYPVPKQVETVVNHRVYGGRDVVVQVAGGVRGDLMSVLTAPGKVKPSPRLGSVAEGARPEELPDGRWWWDVR